MPPPRISRATGTWSVASRIASDDAVASPCWAVLSSLLSPIPARRPTVGVGERHGKVFAVDGMVEKPPKGTAPSNLSITGRYILQPEIFKILETQEKGAGGEIQLTDGMKKLSESQKFYGLEFEGERHDCGSRAGFLRANIAYGMARPDLRDGLRAELKKYLGK